MKEQQKTIRLIDCLDPKDKARIVLNMEIKKMIQELKDLCTNTKCSSDSIYGHGCDHCGACYDLCVDKEDVLAILKKYEV